jgi:DNA-binding XRE family transcriptional regulator
MTIGQKIFQLRREKGVSQEMFAKAIDVHRTNVNAWEKERAKPQFNRIVKIASYFNVSVDFLTDETISVNVITKETEIATEVLLYEMANIIAQRDKISYDQAKSNLLEKINLIKSMRK